MWGCGFWFYQLRRTVSVYLQMSGEMWGGSLAVFAMKWSLFST